MRSCPRGPRGEHSCGTFHPQYSDPKETLVQDLEMAQDPWGILGAWVSKKGLEGEVRALGGHIS